MKPALASPGGGDKCWQRGRWEVRNTPREVIGTAKKSRAYPLIAALAM